MSYAGSTTRGQSSRPAAPNTASGSGLRPLGLPEAGALPATDTTDHGHSWREIGLFSAGLALGALIATGATLLLAPQSGRETREAIARRGRKVRRRTHNAWDDLRDELAMKAFTSRRKLNRELRHRRRALEELM